MRADINSPTTGCTHRCNISVWCWCFLSCQPYTDLITTAGEEGWEGGRGSGEVVGGREGGGEEEWWAKVRSNWRAGRTCTCS